MASLPADRNILTEGQNTLNAQLGLAGGQLQGFQTYAPAYGAANLSGISNIALGGIDTQAFLAQHPEFVEGYQNEVARGGDPNRWLQMAISNASYIDPASIPRAGGATGLNAAITGAANQQTTASNTALRGGNLADATAFAPQQQALTRGLNSELYSTLAGLDRRAGKAVGAGAAEQQAGALASAGFGQFMPGRISMIDPNSLGSVRNVSAMSARQDPFLSMVAQRANAGPSAIQSTLQQQAQAQLAQGGQLSAQEARNVINPIMAKYAAAGLGQGNAVTADQVLALDAATRARRLENQNFAAGVDQQGYQQSLGLGQLGLGGSGAMQGYAGQNLQAQTANLGADISQRGQNLSALQGNQSAEAQNAQLAQQAFLANLQAQAQQFGQLTNVAGMEAARRAEDQRNSQLAVQGRLATYQDPFSGMAVNTGNQGTNAALLGLGSGIYGQGNNIAGANFDPFTQYGADLYNTNYNAAYNNAINQRNNSSSMFGSILGAVGTIGGAMLGGPAGASAGGFLGGLLGGSPKPSVGLGNV